MSLMWKSVKVYLAGFSTSSYSPLRTDSPDCIEEQARDLEKAEKVDASGRRTVCLSLYFLLASILLYALLPLYPPSDEYCEGKMWAWSPILGASRYEWRQMDSSQLPGALYGGPPTEDRLDAWEHIVEDGFIGFPRDRLKAIRKSEAEDWWSLPYPDQDTIIAGPEFYHQLHCVRLLWLAALRDEWDYTKGGNISSWRYAMHTKHCYLALEKMLECQADISPVLFEQGDGVWETRNAPHKCKDFPALVQWQADNTVCGRPCQYS
ncbi:hypothetical protein ASPZODRAFT_2119918 [Penicilliopsis zonata CBS 506.65]|uniref:Cyclochlorotine biosynthesis protein O n=1 Tax=Penicilliopsis zonata CBS 506.65 TaxID=1073090 RepID=A0A1L9S5U4_9EURO|nr:hypothetical protein ASPZODRAFT_2119918 [Penicilliopsis zonata CBS 506.65]OJJ42507.1 hypothetical protein ASPZODRAFT_2119918 [Penicilliopsis zonata CBS 506.65]